MHKIILSKVNEVYLRLDLEMGQSLELKEYLSCYAPNYKYNPKFRAKMWDGKISFYDYRLRTIPIGLLPKFVDFCHLFDYEYEFDFDISELSEDISREEIENFCTELSTRRGSKFIPRDYQMDSIVKGIQNKRGVILSPTGCLDPKSEIKVDISEEDYEFLKNNFR